MLFRAAYRQKVEIACRIRAATARPDVLYVVHDGSEYAERTKLLLHAGHRNAVALLDPPGERNDAYSANEQYATALTRLIGELRAETQQPATVVAVGASLGALAHLHAHARHGLYDGLLLQSGSFFRRSEESYEAGFEFFDRVATFVGELHAGLSIPSIPTTITCELEEENLACNEALADALGVPCVTHPGGHDWTAWARALADELVPLSSQVLRPTLQPLARSLNFEPVRVSAFAFGL